MSDALDTIGIFTCNKNGVPFDTEKPMVTSGIRLGTPAPTIARVHNTADFAETGKIIGGFLKEMQKARCRIRHVRHLKNASMPCATNTRSMRRHMQ